MSLFSPLPTQAGGQTGFFSWVAERLRINLKQAKCGHESKETLTPESWRCLLCGVEGGIVPPGPTTEGYTYEEKEPSTIIHPFAVGDAVPSVADPVGTVCTHPSISIHRFLSGETRHTCTRCLKHWNSLADAVNEAEPTEPINMTVEESPVIPRVVSDLAAEMSLRLGQAIAALADATGDPAPMNPGTVSMYADFLSMADLKANTPFVAAGYAGTAINQPQQDPTLLNAAQKLQKANREANEALAVAQARRRKAMEDAARSAAEAFDAGMADDAAPVKLEVERKLKVVL